MKQEKKLSDKAGAICRKLWLPVFIIFALCFYFRLQAPQLGEAVGNMKGSYRGWTEGISSGAEAGKQEGISAKDTEVRIAEKLEETKNLQVLLADLKLTDIYTQGQEGEKYAALMMLKGEAVFAVDLTQAKVEYDGEKNLVTIEVPRPVPDIYLDDSTLETVAEYHPTTITAGIRRLFEDAQDGYTGYLNSRWQWKQKASEELSNNETLKEEAENAAKEQIKNLALAICGQKCSVKVQFAETEEQETNE